MTLGHVVEMSGPYLDNTAVLASHLRVRSVRFISHILSNWKHQLKPTEQSLLAAYCDGCVHPDGNDPIPVLKIVPDCKNCTGCLLQFSELFKKKRFNVLVGKKQCIE